MLHPKWIEFLPKSLACRAIGPLLPLFAEGSPLTDAQRSAVSRHIAACVDCREEVAAIRDIGALLRQRGPAALPAAVPAADLWSRIEAQIVAEPLAPPTPARRPLRTAYVLGPVFAAVMVAAIVYGPDLIRMPQYGPAPSAATMPESGLAKGAMAPTAPDVPVKEIAAVGAAIVSSQPDEDSAGAPVERARSVESTPRPPAAMSESALDAPRREAKAAREEMVASAGGSGRRLYRDPFAPMPPAMSAPINHAPVAAEAPRSVYQMQVASNNPAPTYFATGALQDTRVMAKNSMKPADEIEIVDAMPSGQMNVPVLASTPLVHLALPAATAKSPASRNVNGTILIVNSNAGSGESTYAVRSSPSEQLNRQQQRRSLFGGYGVAAAAVLPATDSVNRGNDDSSPGTSPW